MTLNDVLKRHQGCLLECEEKHDFCEYNPPRDHECEDKRNACRIGCDFDHSPN